MDRNPLSTISALIQEESDAEASAYYDILRCVLHVLDSVPDRAGEICGAVECMPLCFSFQCSRFLLAIWTVNLTSGHSSGYVALVWWLWPFHWPLQCQRRREGQSSFDSHRGCAVWFLRGLKPFWSLKGPRARLESKVQSLTRWNCSCLLNLMRMNQSLVQDCSFCKNCCHAHDPCLSSLCKKANATNLEPVSFLVICNLTLCPLSHSAGAWLHGALVSRSRGLCCKSWEQFDQLFLVPQFKSESEFVPPWICGFVGPKRSSPPKVRQEEAGLERMLPRDRQSLRPHCRACAEKPFLLLFGNRKCTDYVFMFFFCLSC